ncbi:uncharacterized protein LOC126892588 [Diabrotica virgifera virgifera]|uniref:Transposable element P transposase n=1 Tax=Diabrotica virgifera virgifera TaxID=50390 RepID=A0ABM5L6P6_DIAVI|nr:uncharacterized protein LOC126892588 [Diabrotica virgifera virgifera]
MMRGLLHNWKIPICYFVTGGPIHSDNLKNIVVEVVSKLQNIGYIPKVLVCDQASNNRALFKLLGACKDQPAIEIGNQRIFTVFDTPHLLKSLRNNFLNKKLTFFADSNQISWQDIEYTYNIDRTNVRARCMVKITDVHINPNNFQKMRVKLAAQIFSNSVASAISTAKSVGQLHTKTAPHTAEFLKIINNIFDGLNSKYCSDSNPNRKPMSTLSKSTENLKAGLEYLKKIKVFENQKERNNIHCLHGFQWTILSVLCLWEELQKYNVSYLLTSFLNQDPLENFFSIVRNRGGYNPTPSVSQLRIAIKHNTNIKLKIALDNGNCEIAQTDNLDLTHEVTSVEISDESIETQTVHVEQSLDMQKENNDNQILSTAHSSKCSITNLETCAVTYVAGYIYYKIIKNLNCSKCQEDLLKDNKILLQKHELMLLFRDYGANEEIKFLQRPSDLFVTITTILLEKFHEAFNLFKVDNAVFEKIETYVTNHILLTTNWLKSCEDHKRKIIKFLVKIKLFKTCQWYNVNESKQKTKREKIHRKLLIFDKSKGKQTSKCKNSTSKQQKIQQTDSHKSKQTRNVTNCI